MQHRALTKPCKTTTYPLYNYDLKLVSMLVYCNDYYFRLYVNITSNKRNC